MRLNSQQSSSIFSLRENENKDQLGIDQTQKYAPIQLFITQKEKNKINIAQHMNWFPTLYQQKRKQKFSNPLSGQVYDNDNFLKSCFSYAAPKEEIVKYDKKQKNEKKSKSVIFQPKKTMYYTHKPKHSQHSFIQKQNQTTQKFHSSKKLTQTNKLSINKNTEQLSQRKNCYPDIQVKILDAIEKPQDLATKSIKVNLQSYFNLFFNSNLLGAPSYEFIDMVEKYIRSIVSENKLDAHLDTKDYPPQFLSVKSKYSLLENLKQLEEKNDSYGAEVLVRYLCIPDKEFRESCYKDIIYMLARQLYEKFNINYQRQYALLDESGQLITDICQIYFSTKKILICQKHNYTKRYIQYQHILENSNSKFKKLSFSEGLKKTFRTKIMNGKFEDYGKQVQNRQESKKQLERAQQLVNGRRSENNIKVHKPSKIQYQSFSQKQKKKQRYSKQKLETTGAGQKSSKQIEYRNEFEHLRTQNSLYDVTFNHDHEQELLLPVVLHDCKLFQQKSEDQSRRILAAAQLLSHKTQEIITWQQYIKLRKIADCCGQKKDIIKFVRNYINWNKFGQLDRQGLTSLLNYVLGDRSKGKQIVEEVIWSWLEKNGVIENGCLLRNTLESWYQRNKLVYFMLISLVMGTNEINTIRMAHQVII